jgi:predicted amidohydrolase YtcJ
MSFQWSQLSSFYLPSTFSSLAEYRLKNLQAYAQIEKAGRPVVYGSDWPVSILLNFAQSTLTAALRLILSMSSLPLK